MPGAGRRGCRGHLRLPGRRHHAVLSRAAGSPPSPAHPGAARAGHGARGRRLRQGQWARGRVRRHVGSRRHEPGDWARRGLHGQLTRGGHHRPGLPADDRARRVPGDGHHRHHPADHEAELSGTGRDRAGGRRGRRDRGRARGTARARVDRRPQRRAEPEDGLEEPRAPPGSSQSSTGSITDPGRKAGDSWELGVGRRGGCTRRRGSSREQTARCSWSATA